MDLFDDYYQSNSASSTTTARYENVSSNLQSKAQASLESSREQAVAIKDNISSVREGKISNDKLTRAVAGGVGEQTGQAVLSRDAIYTKAKGTYDTAKAKMYESTKTDTAGSDAVEGDIEMTSGEAVESTAEVSSALETTEAVGESVMLSGGGVNLVADAVGATLILGSVVGGLVADSLMEDHAKKKAKREKEHEMREETTQNSAIRQRTNEIQNNLSSKHHNALTGGIH